MCISEQALGRPRFRNGLNHSVLAPLAPVSQVTHDVQPPDR